MQAIEKVWIFGGGMMEYYKLIAIQIDDFCSSIFFEGNYGINDMNNAKKLKQELEEKGYVCLLAKTTSNIQI